VFLNSIHLPYQLLAQDCCAKFFGFEYVMITRKEKKAGRFRPRTLFSIRNKSAKVQIKLSQ